jgi:hypothetical protein
MSEPREEEKQLGWVCDTTRGFQIIQILSTDSDRRTKVLPLQLRSSKRVNNLFTIFWIFSLHITLI